MPNYAIHDAAGTIRAIFAGPDEEAAQAQAGSGEFLLECDAGPYDAIDVATGTVIRGVPPSRTMTHYVLDNVLVAYTPEQAAAKAAKPNYPAEWSNESFEWIDLRTLAEVKAQQKAAIDAERVIRTFAPIEYAGATFDADETAMRNVSGWQTQIAAGSALPPGFVWRDATNVDHPADAAFVNGLGAAITLRGTLLYAQAWALKAAIDAAETPEAIEAITWDD